VKNETARAKRDACPKHGVKGFPLDRCRTPAACLQAFGADTFPWTYKGKDYKSTVIPQPCPMCGARAVIELPEAIRAEQPDETTHVCHPLQGGCNHGFVLDRKGAS